MSLPADPQPNQDTIYDEPVYLFTDKAVIPIQSPKPTSKPPEDEPSSPSEPK